MFSAGLSSGLRKDRPDTFCTIAPHSEPSGSRKTTLPELRIESHPLSVCGTEPARDGCRECRSEPGAMVVEDHPDGADSSGWNVEPIDERRMP